MICKVKRTIEKYRLLENVKTVVVGFSGGADSVCLLDILGKIKDEYGIIVKACHLNHNLRGEEAERDLRFAENFCKKNSLELFVFSEDIRELCKKYGMGPEECGRKVRYECFAKCGTDAVATAHNLSDSAETVLFNLARGTGSRGLCGIKARREPNIIRPLVECTAEEIREYCKENGLEYVTDSTNLSDDYKRNYIRHNIIPQLKHINENAVEAIGDASAIISEESDFIEKAALELIAQSERENGYLSEPFLSSHPAVRKRAIALLLSERMNKTVESRHINLVNEAILSKKGKIEIGKDLYIKTDGAIITFCCCEKQEKFSAVGFDENFLAVTPYASYEIVSCSKKEKNAIDRDKTGGSLFLSSRMEGDRIRLSERKHTKTLKKLFCEMKIPVSERDKKAVLHDGDSLVWVEDVGTDSSYLADENTKNAFIIKRKG